MKPYALLTSIALMLLACNRNKSNNDYCPQTVHCTAMSTLLLFNDYSATEQDSIIITRYTPDGSFMIAKDSQTYKYPTFIPPITTDFDYDVYLPIVNKHYHISDITQPKDSSFIYTMCAGSGKHAPAPSCSYYASSANINGIVSQPVSYKDAYAFQLKK